MFLLLLIFFRRLQPQLKKSLQPQRQVQLYTFLVCQQSHLHAMLTIFDHCFRLTLNFALRQGSPQNHQLLEQPVLKPRQQLQLNNIRKPETNIWLHLQSFAHRQRSAVFGIQHHTTSYNIIQARIKRLSSVIISNSFIFIYFWLFLYVFDCFLYVFVVVVVDIFQETATTAEEKPATTEASAVVYFSCLPTVAFACYVDNIWPLFSFDTELCPQAGIPAEPSATGAASAETTPTAPTEQHQEASNKHLTSFAVFCTQTTQCRSVQFLAVFGIQHHIQARIKRLSSVIISNSFIFVCFCCCWYFSGDCNHSWREACNHRGKCSCILFVFATVAFACYVDNIWPYLTIVFVWHWTLPSGRDPHRTISYWSS